MYENVKFKLNDSDASCWNLIWNSDDSCHSKVYWRIWHKTNPSINLHFLKFERCNYETK